MNNLNLSFTLQVKDEFDSCQIKEILFHVYGVPDDKSSQQNFLNGNDLVAERIKEFHKQDK